MTLGAEEAGERSEVIRVRGEGLGAERAGEGDGRKLDAVCH
jgi:hypothetical protein